MAKAKSDDKVAVHYTGKLDDGTVFDSSEGREPLTFTLGQKQIIPGFENSVLGMTEGDSKTVVIPPKDAYGSKQDELIQKFPKEQLPPEIKPEVGQRLQMQRSDGQTIQVIVNDVDEDSMTIDANHPLAGETLHFDIRLESIIK
ncbi:MAG: peptidylprolyl isomerase [candidate division Zixibacteria bacterium]|nr:peptidylprolyl isomerase [candidate division Zixibacteria bacterium]